MTARRAVACLLACLVVVGCAYFKPQYPRAIKYKTEKKYTPDERYWGGEIGEVQGFVMPLGLVSAEKNAALREATKDEYTFFMVAMHHVTSDEGLSMEKLAPAIRVAIQNQMVSNVDAPAVVAPIVLNRLAELNAEKTRLGREVSAVAPTEGAAAAPKSPESKAQLKKVEADCELLNQLRAYFVPGRIDTKRGVVWFQIMATPGKEDIAGIQHVQWTYGGGEPVDMRQYGYKFDVADKLKLKQVAERKLPSWLPDYLKRLIEHW